MNTKLEPAPELPQELPDHHLSRSSVLPQLPLAPRLDARLKKLRRERRLVERAIDALTEISRARDLRVTRDLKARYLKARYLKERRAARN
jgi:hypothetical protein